MPSYEKVVDTLSENQITELEAAFNMFDSQRRGKISTTQLAEVLKMLGRGSDEESLQQAVADIDIDGSGEVTLHQFLVAVALKIKESESKEQVVALFKAFDDDGNGSISVGELRQVMAGLVDRLTNEEVEGMVRQSDSQGTGEISYNGG